ncbi:MAG: LysR substrate-binding domain-containing protein [Chthoniobacter sp.]|nr:LysR substrate-binding domain-containing protein [Chthoniobacter sp.]
MKAFVEVVRENGFARAARRLHVTQSTVSKAVKQLEDELNFQLLDRAGRQCRLTAPGRLVFQKAEAILAQGEDLRAELAEMRGLRKDVLRLGLPLIGSSILFARWFAIYRRRFPRVEIQLLEHGSSHLEKLLLAGELDLAASLLPVAADFAWQEVRREPIDVLLPAGHALANRRQLAFKELAAEPMILYSEGFALNPIIAGACRKNGFEPRIVAESGQVDFVMELVAANMGIAFVPRMIAERRNHPQFRRIPVGQPPIYWHMALIWRRNGYQSEAAKAWLSLTGALAA